MTLLEPIGVSPHSPARPEPRLLARGASTDYPDCMFKQHELAPVPADDLAATLAPFGSSRMLPREAYVDPAVFEWEQRNVFSGWKCVGHAADMAGTGSQRAIGSGADGMLLVTGDDGVIRAFANTCRHRGHELLACGTTAKRRQFRARSIPRRSSE